ncbi:MAG TPA: ParB N-terminal domain-containing protein [Phycisphaerae bacterium]|nr:ParB N-terminal domain-containing protein [Phycisphaerae bacterium]HQL76144.1 ParB N-terminal domain-containing protein [Phycisphaerae bacterium]
MKLPLKKIRLDGGTQTRARIHEDVLTEYAEDMKSGSPFPPLIVFHDGKDYWLGDGFHRWGAAMKLQLDSIECEIRQGTMADAQWFSFSANKANGMRRTNDDKVRAVKSALRHCKGERSDSEIARHVGVDHHTVAKYRDELVVAGEITAAAKGSASWEVPKMDDEPCSGQPARVVTRKGKTYQMKVGSIGKAKKPRAAKVSKDHFAAMKLRPDLPDNVSRIKADSVQVELPTNHVGNAAYALYHTFQWSYLDKVIAEIRALRAAEQERKV